MEDAVLDHAFLHRLTREVAQVVFGELARIHFLRKSRDLLVGLAKLAQFVIIQEEHAHLGVLRDAVTRTLVSDRLP